METIMLSKAKQSSQTAGVPHKSSLEDVEAKLANITLSNTSHPEPPVTDSEQSVKNWSQQDSQGGIESSKARGSDAHSIDEVSPLSPTRSRKSTRSPGQSQQDNRLRCQKIVEIAKRLFEFLLPLQHSSKMASAYWGNIHWYLCNPEAQGTLELDARLKTVEGLKLEKITRTLAHDFKNGPQPASFPIPASLRKAALRLPSFLAIGTGAQPKKKLVAAELYRILRLLETGREQLFRCLQYQNCGTKEAVLPRGVLTLLIQRLLKNLTKDAPDIVSIYFDYAQKLEQQVQQRPYSRSHQEKIGSLRQEIRCILQVLEEQDRVLHQLLQVADTTDAVIWVESPENYLLTRCRAALDDRVLNFRNLEVFARDLTSFVSLPNYNLLRIESSKDRQEAAILVFTVITIIFLPLSFVSSFFGMNTADIRSLGTPQWVFWASALPLTTVVVGLSLFIAQKLEPVKDAWSRVVDRWGAQEASDRPPTATVEQEDHKRERVRVSPTAVRRSTESSTDYEAGRCAPRLRSRYRV
ncbi:MAG: hypothetical protein Q9201_000015 [Fulgogasparrea decipioides]